MDPTQLEVYSWILKNYGEFVADQYWKEHLDFLEEWPGSEYDYSTGGAFIWADSEWGFQFWNDLDDRYRRDNGRDD